MARVLPPFFVGELGDPRHVARAFGELEPVERGLRAGLGLHPADVAASRIEAWAFSTLTAWRAARTAAAGSVIADRDGAPSADQSTPRAANGRSSPPCHR